MTVLATALAAEAVATDLRNDRRESMKGFCMLVSGCNGSIPSAVACAARDGDGVSRLAYAHGAARRKSVPCNRAGSNRRPILGARKGVSPVALRKNAAYGG
jgi:hypothetical protein